MQQMQTRADVTSACQVQEEIYKNPDSFELSPRKLQLVQLMTLQKAQQAEKASHFSERRQDQKHSRVQHMITGRVQCSAAQYSTVQYSISWHGTEEAVTT